MGQLKKFISVVFVAVLYIGIVKGSSTVIDVGELREDDGDSMNIMTGSSTSLPAHLNDDDTDSIVDSADSPEAFLHESSIDCDDPVKLDEDVKANKSKRQKSVFDGEELREKRPLCKIEKTGSRDTMKGSERTRNNSSKPSNRVALGHQDHTSPVAVESRSIRESSDDESDSDDSHDSDPEDIVSLPIDLNADIFLVVLSCMSVPARAVSMIAQLRSVNRNLNVIMEDVIARLNDSFQAKLDLRRVLVTSRFRSRPWKPRDVAWYKQLFGSSDSYYSEAHNDSLVGMAPYIEFNQFDSGLLSDVFQMIAHHADRPIRTMFRLRRVCKHFLSILDMVMPRLTVEIPILATKLRALGTYRLLRKRRFDSWSHQEEQHFRALEGEKNFGAILKRFCGLYEEEGLVFNSSVPLPWLIIKSELIQLIIYNKAALYVLTLTIYCICVDQVARIFQNPNVYWATAIYLVCLAYIFDVRRR